MKSSDFSRKSKTEEFQPQQTFIKKKRFNWGVIIYATIVIIILAFLGQFLVNKFFYVEAIGQVLYKKLNVQLPADAQVVNIYKNEGENVMPGDTLFRYTWSDAVKPDKSGSGYGFINKKGLSKQWIQQELLDVEKDIQGLNIKNRSLRQRLSHYQERRAKVKKGVYLNVYTNQELDALKDKISRLKSDINANLSEKRELRSYQNELRDKSSSYKQRMKTFASQGFRLDPDTLKKYSNYYLSPIPGNLTRILKRRFEVAMASEKIMTIHKKNQVIVRGFFDQSDLPYIQEGDEVTIRFPDGTKSLGRIQQMYFSTHVLPEAFQQKGEPVNRKIAADIKPLQDGVEKDWQEFYKMSVTINKQMLKLDFPW